MTIYWPVVIGITVAWLIVSLVAAVAYMDAMRWKGRPNFAQSLAHTILWPIIAPLLLIKTIIRLGRFTGEVASEIPTALSDIWKWK